MRVVVVGAGLAGLRTAQLLVRAGHEVLVYEARDRVGGRLWTVSLGEDEVEAGGEWVDADHARVLGLMGEFGLEPVRSEQYPGVVVLDGDVRPEDAPGADAEADAAAVHEAAVEACSGLGERVWESADAAYFDSESLGEWLDLHCITPEGRRYVEMVQRSDEGEDTDRVGLLGWLWSYRNYLARSSGEMSLYRIPGGAGGLCERMTLELGERVHLGRRLRSVDLTEEGVQCWFEGEMVFADRVVVTVPTALLGGIEWPVEMPVEYQTAWSAVGMGRVVKVLLRFEEAWWEGLDWRGRLLCDLPCQQVWIGGSRVLTCYICGSMASVVRGSRDAVGMVLRGLAEVFPAAASSFVEGELVDWVGDEFAGGAFPSLGVGSVGAVKDWPGRAWEGIHFAGDGTAQWFGFMEGALESAERVVGEIG